MLELKMVKPEKVEAYRCSVCSSFLFMSYQMAEEHVNINPDKPLPRGLVFVYNRLPQQYNTGVIIDEGKVIQGDRRYSVHTHKHEVKYISFKNNEIADSREFNSEEFRACLEGIVRLLGREEFESSKAQIREILRAADINLRLRRTMA